LPDEILWRQKEAFSDGVSSFKKKSWVDVLKDHAHNLISDDNKKINNR
jgi:asparagine synthase (glutamine-hydrolysing)